MHCFYKTPSRELFPIREAYKPACFPKLLKLEQLPFSFFSMKQVLKPRKLYEEPEELVEYLDVQKDLLDYLKKHPHKKREGSFSPIAFYNREGDIFELCWEDVPYYCEVTDGDFELCREFETHRIVGIKLWSCKKRMGLKEIKE